MVTAERRTEKVYAMWHNYVMSYSLVGYLCRPAINCTDCRVQITGCQYWNYCCSALSLSGGHGLVWSLNEEQKKKRKKTPRSVTGDRGVCVCVCVCAAGVSVCVSRVCISVVWLVVAVVCVCVLQLIVGFVVLFSSFSVSPNFRETNWVCDHFQYFCHMQSRIPSSSVDLVYAV